MNYSFPKVIDSSMLAQFKTCQALWYQSSIQEWKPKEHSIHLHAGGAFAKALERTRRAFYDEGENSQNAIGLGLQALISAYGDFNCPSDSAKSLERMCGAFVFYWDNYPLGDSDSGTPITLPSGRSGIEFTFAHPIPILHPETGDPLLVSGAMDAIYKIAGGTYIVDEKTTSSLGATWSRQWDLRGQFTCYAWGCAQAGIQVDGAIVRGIAILKTKFDTQQVVTHRPKWQIDRWYEEMLQYVAGMVRVWESKRPLHNLDHACGDFGGCQFRESCSTQEPQSWLETFFERRHWDPILRKETVL